MNLLNLAARVCCEFNLINVQSTRTIQKVKGNQPRDVVTELDMRLHDITDRFVKERMTGCTLLSEEGVSENSKGINLKSGELLIVDPLDGSSNYAMGMPNYGYMAAHLQHGQVVGSVIVLPEHSQYIAIDEGKLIEAQPIASVEGALYGSVYYAYPPDHSSHEREVRFALQQLIDAESSGMYRYGSACAGLYQFLSGKHMAFIGHGIRIWDAIAYLPVLALRDFTVYYCIKNLTITLVASSRVGFLKNSVRILEEQQGITMHEYIYNEPLKVAD